MDFITLVKEASTGDNIAGIMTDWSEILDDYLCKTKDNNASAYDELMDELYVTIYGERLSEEMAEKWVNSMKPVGKHWTLEETKKALPSYDEIDGYAIANLIYNNYYDIIKNNDTLVMKMTANWLDDEGAGENKTYNYWKCVVNRD